MKIILIRHGQTEGNAEGRYIGTTDEPLSPDGREIIKNNVYLPAEIIISSPMLRCRQTAEIIYGRYDDVFDGLKECDFGEFENKNYKELDGNEMYQQWIDSGGTLPFPGGESMESFSKRCISAFEKAVDKYKNAKSMAFVIHGGTIMSIAKKYNGGNFYDYRLKNGEYMVISYMK